MSPKADGVERPVSAVGMVKLFDVTSDGAHRYTGYSDGGHRRVVDGSQLLAQSIVAASRELPDHGVRSAHAVFTRVVDDARPLWFEVDVTHRGRTFAGAIVTVGQGDRRCATVSVLLDVVHADVIRHGSPPPTVGSPVDSGEVAMPMVGRQLRVVGMADPNDPDEVGPPVLDAWVRYDSVPERPDLARALIAHFTGHLSLSATMRGHVGIGTGQAHETVSSAVMSIGVAFHEPVAWNGWLLYHHESTHVGAGMSYVRGQVFTEGGDLIASFVQEAMLRAFDQDPTSHPIPTVSRL